MKFKSNHIATLRNYLKNVHVNATAVQSAITELDIPIAANEVLAFEFHISHGFNGVLTGAQFALFVPTGANLKATMLANTSSNTGFQTSEINTSGTATATIHNYNSVDGLCIIRGVVINGNTAGVISLKHANSGGGTSTINIGSYSRADNVK